MRLTAIRGYVAYASEEEVAILMKKMLEILKGDQKVHHIIIRNTKSCVHLF